MIGMAIGAERIARARQIAWTAGLTSFISVGALATVIALFPSLWVDIFTQDEAVRIASREYLRTVAPMYAFIGLAMSMYFSSQGAARMIGPVLAQTARLAFIALGGIYLTMHDAMPASFFKLAASSMVLLGVLSCTSVVLTRWGPKPAAIARVRPALTG
jgi:Na+-driven multidrug efflux pump